MRFKQYVVKEGRGSITRIARESGVSYQTIWAAANGKALVRYGVAKAVSDATAGVVTVAELCEPPKDAA